MQLYWNHISTWVFFFKFAAYFQYTSEWLLPMFQIKIRIYLAVLMFLFRHICFDFCVLKVKYLITSSVCLTKSITKILFHTHLCSRSNHFLREYYFFCQFSPSVFIKIVWSFFSSKFWLHIRYFLSSTYDNRRNEGDCIGNEIRFVLAAYLRLEE